MEWLLERLLPAHAREGIVGDLREEYVESMLPRRGRLRADLWYTRHALSFLPGALRESRVMGKLLFATSGFTMICMLWLASMELKLKHPGYATRMALDFCFAASCLATFVLRGLASPRPVSERCLRGTGFVMILFGGETFLENAHATHFEGHIFFVSLALIVQGVLMVLTLGRNGGNIPSQAAK
jgi:hypothetical protein